MGAEHCAALVRLFGRNAGSTVIETFTPFPLSETQARRIATEPRQDLYFVGELGDELIGLTMLRGFDEGYVIPSFGVFIDEGHQGHGHGRRLTAWTIAEAHRRGCPGVRLSVYAGNHAARRIYEQLGFVEVERTSIQVAGHREEKIVMHLGFAPQP